MNICCGTDIVDIAEFEIRIKKSGGRILSRIFSQEELSYCYGKAVPIIHLAGKFAGKEAVMKAFKTGWGGAVNFKNILILNNSKGSPNVCFQGDLKQNNNVARIEGIDISISHTGKIAVANVVICFMK